ncbi:MAG: hypothetical protein AAF468_02635 [Pseudomonadota bacterium]
MMRAFVAFVFGLLWSAPAFASDGPCASPPASEGLIIESGGGKLSVVPDPGSKPVGEQFSLRLIPCDPGTSLSIPSLDATMPMHGHGMNYRPKITPQSDGSTLAEGMLFHMPGKWRLEVDVVANEKRQRVTRDFVVKP